jgi:hypothetical protein
MNLFHCFYNRGFVNKDGFIDDTTHVGQRFGTGMRTAMPSAIVLAVLWMTNVFARHDSTIAGAPSA